MTTIATTILQQLGGYHFMVMTGARQLVDIHNGLRFRIGKNHSQANMVRITLNAMDTYDMEFIKMPSEPNYVKLLEKCIAKGLDFKSELEKRTTPKTLKTYNGVYCDQLQTLFTDYTWMYTHL